MYFSREISEIFESTYLEVHFWTSAFVSLKDTANKTWLESSQTYMMEFFGENS